MKREQEILDSLLPEPMGDGPMRTIEMRVDPERLATYLAELEERLTPKPLEEDADTICDDFGSCWDKKCPDCGTFSMEIVRPGKAQCTNCD